MVRTGEREVAYRLLIEKYAGKRSHGRPTHSWEHNIKMYT